MQVLYMYVVRSAFGQMTKMYKKGDSFALNTASYHVVCYNLLTRDGEGSNGYLIRSQPEFDKSEFDFKIILTNIHNTMYSSIRVYVLHTINTDCLNSEIIETVNDVSRR